MYQTQWLYCMWWKNSQYLKVSYSLTGIWTWVTDCKAQLHNHWATGQGEVVAELMELLEFIRVIVLDVMEKV